MNNGTQPKLVFTRQRSCSIRKKETTLSFLPFDVSQQWAHMYTGPSLCVCHPLHTLWWDTATQNWHSLRSGSVLSALLRHSIFFVH